MTDTTRSQAASDEQPRSTADFLSATERAESRSDPIKEQSRQSASTPLLPDAEVGEMRSRWDSIQAGFVDEPRRAVEDADALVATAMKRLAETFASERSELEKQWDRGDDVSTEDLRLALQRYRAFFGRLLSL